MRQISKRAANAFFAGSNAIEGNTRVTVTDENVRMYLHENLIAHLSTPAKGKPVLLVTLAGYPTPTTRDRINAILETGGYTPRVWQAKLRQDKKGTTRQWLGLPRDRREISDHEVIRL